MEARGVLLHWGAALADLGVGGGRGQRLDAGQHNPGLCQVPGQTAALPLHRAARSLWEEARHS